MWATERGADRRDMYIYIYMYMMDIYTHIHMRASAHTRIHAHAHIFMHILLECGAADRLSACVGNRARG